MAGDWIKMRGNLWDDPRVLRLCDLCDSSEAPIIGALYWLWATADQHTENGILPGLTLRQIDRKTGVQGFGQALCDIGWLADHPEGVQITRFEEHNGASAKRRSMEAQRKANARNASACDADTEQTEDGQIPPSCGAREEKRREEEKKDPPASRVPRASRKCPEGFVVTDELRQWASEKAPGVDLDTETAAFRDYTFRNSMTDWVGAWRNWMRKAKPSRVAQAAPMSFKERETKAKEARFREMAGSAFGMVPGVKQTGDFIDMEVGNVPLIASN